MEFKVPQEPPKQLRSRQKELINSIPAPLLLCDEKGIVEYCKPGRGKLPLFSEGSAVGKKVSQLKLGELLAARNDMQALEWVVRETADSGKEHATDLMVCVPHGPSYWFEVQGVRCGEQNVLLVFHNISERKKLEMQLERALRAAELSNRAKTDFLANISHELRTPLNAVIGFAELLQTDINVAEDDRREFIKQIELSGQVLLRLVNELLELASVDSGQINLKLRRVNAASVLRNSIGLVQAQGKSKNVGMSVNLPSRDTELLADEDRLKQVLINLLGNAIKYTPEGGQIHVHTAVTPNDHLEIQIADSGPGIAPEMLDRVFERFARGNGRETSNVPGTGLGLSIVKGLVEAHGGEVRVECPGLGNKGSRFTVSLPMGLN